MNSKEQLNYDSVECETNYFDYIHTPITPSRKKIFEKVISKARGDVLDLGCGQAGHYWALGYATKVSSISFYDYSMENTENLHAVIKGLTPQQAEHDFNSTIRFLEASCTIPKGSVREIVEQMLVKIKEIRRSDFIKDKSERKFDTILSIEAIECLDTNAELVKALKNVHSMLKSGGIFAGVTLRYSKKTDRISGLIKRKLEGRLNPDAANLAESFKAAGFGSFSFSKSPINHMAEYQEEIFYLATK